MLNQCLKQNSDKDTPQLLNYLVIATIVATYDLTEGDSVSLNPFEWLI
jgi:hypothetical protein